MPLKQKFFICLAMLVCVTAIGNISLCNDPCAIDTCGCTGTCNSANGDCVPNGKIQCPNGTCAFSVEDCGCIAPCAQCEQACGPGGVCVGSGKTLCTATGDCIAPGQECPGDCGADGCSSQCVNGIAMPRDDGNGHPYGQCPGGPCILLDGNNHCPGACNCADTCLETCTVNGCESSGYQRCGAGASAPCIPSDAVCPADLPPG